MSHQTLIPTMSLRWVDKATNNVSTVMVLQQLFTDAHTGKHVWIDVPFAGHVSKLGEDG